MEPTQTWKQLVERDLVDDERIPHAFVRWMPIFVPLAAATMALGMFVIYFEILARG
jgi:hypothetical protein